MSAPDKTWRVNHFGHSNGVGKLQDDVPALLRRVADTIESLGDVEIQDVAFHSELDDDARDRPSTTTDPMPRSRRRVRWEQMGLPLRTTSGTAACAGPP
jgi:hypothetical protein